MPEGPRHGQQQSTKHDEKEEGWRRVRTTRGPEGPRGGKQQRCKGHPTGRSHWTCHFYQFGPQFILFMREGRWQCRGKTSVDSWLHYFQTNPQPQIVIKYRYNLNRLWMSLNGCWSPSKLARAHVVPKLLKVVVSIFKPVGVTCLFTMLTLGQLCKVRRWMCAVDVKHATSPFSVWASVARLGDSQ